MTNNEALSAPRIGDRRAMPSAAFSKRGPLARSCEAVLLCGHCRCARAGGTAARLLRFRNRVRDEKRLAVEAKKASASEYAQAMTIDLESIRRQLDLERRTLAPEGYILETLPYVSRLRCTDGAQHMISFSSLTEDKADAIIREQATYYRRLAAQVEWKVYQHDSPPDLLQRLERHGFEAGLRETVLVLDLNNHRSWIEAPSAYQVIRVEDADQVDLYRQAAEKIFEKDYEFTARELLSGIRRGSAQHRGYVVIEQGTATSIGRLYTHPQSAFGGMYGGGTLKKHRGRGMYRATVAARAREAIQLGARYLLVDALPTSRPILEKLGFMRLTDTWPCTLRL